MNNNQNSCFVESINKVPVDFSAWCTCLYINFFKCCRVNINDLEVFIKTPNDIIITHKGFTWYHLPCNWYTLHCILFFLTAIEILLKSMVCAKWLTWTFPYDCHPDKYTLCFTVMQVDLPYWQSRWARLWVYAGKGRKYARKTILFIMRLSGVPFINIVSF